MKIALLGDTHFGARNDSLAFLDYFNKFYDEIFFPYLKKNKIKSVIQLGDLMDRRKYVNIHTLNQIKEKFTRQFKDNKIELHVLVGNHDSYYKNSIKVNSLRELFYNEPNIYVYDSPKTVKFGKSEIDLIPWIAPDEQQEIYDFITNTRSDVVCGHFEFRNFEMYKGVKSEHGMDESFEQLIRKKYKQIYSGHYHTRSSDGVVHYLGTPYEITWSDCNDPRGFHIYDTETGVIEFIKNPYKLHHRIMFDGLTPDFDYEMYKESFIKVIVTKQIDPEEISVFVENLNKYANPHDIIVTDTSAIAQIDEDELIESIETQDPLTVLLQTVENDSGAKIDKASTKKWIREIYQDAMSMEKE